MLAEEEENDAGGAAEVQRPAAAGGRTSPLAGDDLVFGPRRGCEERGRDEDRAGEGSCL